MWLINTYKRCPCCNGKLATRPRCNDNKKKYIILRLEGYNEI
jgi:hypothetical protein